MLRNEVDPTFVVYPALDPSMNARDRQYVRFVKVRYGLSVLALRVFNDQAQRFPIAVYWQVGV